MNQMAIFVDVKRKIELLAPGGDADSIKAAIAAGADAVYCGLDRFNARNRAANISIDDLPGILRLAHQNHCKVFLTLNIVVLDSEIPALIALLNKLVNTAIDGIIIQDIGIFYLVSSYFKSLKIHASTQLNTHNDGQIRFLSRLTASRVNLSRELNLTEIKALTTVAHENKLLTEVFVHGSYCISFSGICYMSSVHGGNSGNRGRCSQPCRDPYHTTAVGNEYPLNLKDNSAFFNLKELDEAAVDSLKIEGRIKQFDYVYTVVKTWRKQIETYYLHHKNGNDNADFYKVFNRDFSNGYLRGEIDKNMFIDNPRDHSIAHLSKVNSYANAEAMEKDQRMLYEEKESIKTTVESIISESSFSQIPLSIIVSGEYDSPLKLEVKTPDSSFVLRSEIKLDKKGIEAISRESLLKRLKAINNTEYYIEDLDLSKLQPTIYLPFKELTALKKRLLFILNDSRDSIDPIDAPTLKKQQREKIEPSLLVLISSTKDVSLCTQTDAKICYQLPNAIQNEKAELLELFRESTKLIPWFPAVLLGDDFAAAVDLLKRIQPKQIVTDNTGIAFEANQKGIEWIAGPSLNTTNSYSLLCMKEKFNCAGAFISNEISKTQLQHIKKPALFKLYYSLYHPIALMTTRQCLFHQVSGCEKSRMDENCMPHCAKSDSIRNLKNSTFRIEKSKGNYQRVFNDNNFLNLDIVRELPNMFSGYSIDLRDLQTGTTVRGEKLEIIRLFTKHITGNYESTQELKSRISTTTNTAYRKGI